jgi:hypothetical protein
MWIIKFKNLVAFYVKFFEILSVNFPIKLDLT